MGFSINQLADAAQGDGSRAERRGNPGSAGGHDPCEHGLQRGITHGEVDLALGARQRELQAALQPRHQLREPRAIEREHLELVRAMDLRGREFGGPLALPETIVKGWYPGRRIVMVGVADGARPTVK